jgi:SAM-dependent methyltransferase
MSIFRFCIEKINYILTAINSLTRYKKDASVIKLNLGCGLAVIQGWINIDGSFNALVSKFPQFLQKYFYLLSGARDYYSEEEYLKLLKCKFIHHNLNHGIPFSDSCIDFIYSSHFLEHLSEDQGKTLLIEAFRVLKEGGLLRISIPDLAFAIELYKNGYNSTKKIY